MLHLERVTLREIHLPLVEPFRTVHGEVKVRRILLLELAEGSGARMWSECVAQADAGYSPETVDTCWDAIRDGLAVRVLGNVLSPGAANSSLRSGSDRNPMACAALSMGIWALFALIRGQSLARFLADVARSPEGPRPQVETGIALGMHSSEDALVARARSALAEGYRRIKLKIDPGTALATVSAVRSALGAAAPISVDANGSFTFRDPTHDAILEQLDDFGLVMIEQPLAAKDIHGHAALQYRLRTPICLDESISTFHDARVMAACEGGRVVNIKPGRVGGFGAALHIHDHLASAGVASWCGGMLECGIGRAYNVALASLPGFSEPGELSPSARYWARDVVTPAWTMDAQGMVKVPLDEPGLGVKVDVDFIDDCTVRTAVLDAR